MTDEQNETRRLAIEALEIARLARDEAAASRVLAAGASHDVGEVKAELKAHTRVLNALRETQLEQGTRFVRVEGRLDRVEGRLDRVEGQLGRLETEVRNGFAMMASGMARISELLERGDS